ncbi:hypothetical protein CRG98_010561 [Punica granatum]|uniref:Uncharacterized protein n=1 Tax=Punica granatum TaxID=22663 RepID=A0A2I0KKQ7_PUNGR|nr:hypothetical protein CRG98_010561 [Punica granatum]
MSFALEVVSFEIGSSKPNFLQVPTCQVFCRINLFVSSCYASSTAGSGWLMDSGCTNDMTSDRSMFQEFDGSFSTKARIGNGDCIAVKGRGTVVIEDYTGAKLITGVLYVPEIDQNLLSIGQLVEKGYKSKAHRVFQPQTEKVIISKDATFLEEEKWNWKECSKGEKGVTQQCWSPQLSSEEMVEIEDSIDDYPVRGTRPLSEIYERCNVAVLEPSCFEDAKTDQKWMVTMKEELSMIEKNQTWELVDSPQDRKVIGVKWMYRTKLNSDGYVNKYKVRLVIKDYAHV